MSNTEDAFYGITYFNSGTNNIQTFKKDLELNNVWTKNFHLGFTNDQSENTVYILSQGVAGCILASFNASDGVDKIRILINGINK